MYAKKVFLMLLAVSSLLAANAQVKTKEQMKQERAAKLERLKNEEDETSIIFSKQNAFAIRLNTDGYGIFYEHGKYKTLTLTNLWWISLDERKDPKEERIPSGGDPNFQIGTPFIYGKINNFYQLKVGFGQQRLIGGKDIKNGVAFSAIYGGGITAGLLKPYYLNVTDTSGVNKDIRYSDDNDPYYRLGPVNGSSGIGKGFGEIKFVPGAFARAALRFDYGAYNELLSALEAGVTAQYYTKDMQMMLDQPGKKFFFNAYVALVFGKRK